MWLVLWIIFLTLVCIKLLLNYTYWSRKGVAQFQPWPLFGNAGPTIFGLRSFTDVMRNLYNSASDKRYCGMYNFFRPTLLVRCPDLIKLLLVQEFDTFPEHRFLLPPEADPLFTDNVLTMRGGQKWRDHRSALTSSLTSSKLKVMFDPILQCALNCMNYLEKHEGPSGVNMLNAFRRYNNDVICRVTYGVACDSFKNPDNDFFLMGKVALSILPWRSFKMFLNSISPILAQILRPRKASAYVNKLYRTHVTNCIKQTESYRNDHFSVINLLTKPRKNSLQVALTHEEIIIETFTLYLGAFGTTVATLCYTIHELAFNPDIQKRLQIEIDNTSEISYRSILKMKYLDMVISEALRKWPPVTFLDRRSVKPFTIEALSPEEKPLHLEVGTEIWIPVYSLHRDPAYYPEPEEFDPERFSDTRKSNINQFAYLPFGAGPKKCFGSRFGFLAIKVLIYLILQKFDVVPNKKTEFPLGFDKHALMGIPNGTFWFELQARNRVENT